jgi:serine/threonine-protein kinase RsbW
MTDTTDTPTATVPNGAGPEGPVQLVVPADARYLRLARLTVAGLAGDLGYGVDAIEDLRIAVDELCAAVIEDVAADASLTITYRQDDGALVVEGRCDDPTAGSPALHRVAQELLAMLADDHGVGADGDGRTFRLVKRLPTPR